ncbi:hypothetical protein B0H12DRAFT_102139 [Mycena haematopus]|nr:hypothetical protein B0H12DRAFT_102139 [Mycena haematopus]
MRVLAVLSLASSCTFPSIWRFKSKPQSGGNRWRGITLAFVFGVSLSECDEMLYEHESVSTRRTRSEPHARRKRQTHHRRRQKKEDNLRPQIVTVQTPQERWPGMGSSMTLESLVIKCAMARRLPLPSTIAVLLWGPATGAAPRDAVLAELSIQPPEQRLEMRSLPSYRVAQLLVDSTCPKLSRFYGVQPLERRLGTRSPMIPA